jgi:ATP-binding cassette subfamily B protein
LKDILRLLQLTRRYAGAYSTATVALLVGSAAFLYIPPQLGRLMAALNMVAPGQSDTAAMRAVLTGAALLAVHGVASLVYSFLVSYVAERIVNVLRARFFWNLINQRLDVHPPKALGQIASEFASDLALVQDGLSTTLVEWIRHSLVTVGAFTALFLIDSRMTAFAIAGVGVIAGVLLLFIRKATASLMIIQQCRANVMTLLLESASNAYIIQAYGRGAYMNRRFASRLTEMFARVWRQMFLVASMNPVCLVLFAGVMGALFLYGLQELRNGRLNVPQLISYFTFAAVLVASVSQVGYLSGRLRQAGAMLAKHERMLARPETPRSGEAATAGCMESTPRPLGFDVRGVSFTYPGMEAPAVSDASFLVPPGKVTAIVGESGGGKSTLAAMLCGIYRPQSGAVEVLDRGGEPTGRASADFGPQIAIVPQEPFLFAGTVLENIAFGREEIPESQVRQAARLARIHDFIMALPHGYETRLDEAGKNLSRGQRQRLAIARALAGRPGVVIMDEATASLDVISERAIKGAIDDLRGDVTFVIIAHQGALLTGVDHRIVVRCGAVTSEVMTDAGGVLC